MTGAEIAARFDECWGLWNDGKLEELTRCYSPDAVSDAVRSGLPAAQGPAAIAAMIRSNAAAFPDQKGNIQLELICGHTLISIVLITGTNTGAMGAMPATGKKIGLFLSQVIDLDDAGRAKREREFFDTATLLGQLRPNKDQPVRAAVDKLPRPKQIVVASGDGRERANLAAHRREIDAFNKRDVATLEQIFDDDLVWFEGPDATDYDKKTILGNMQGFWKDFSDIKLTVNETWAAGDYVASVVSLDGTNDKSRKQLSLPFVEIYRFAGGRAKAVWCFYQGSDLARQVAMMSTQD